MNLQQNSIILMLNNLINFFTNNAGVFDIYLPMKNSIAAVTDKYNTINAAVQIQQEDIKGYTLSKKQKRNDMAFKADALRRKLQGIATDKNDVVMYKKMNIPLSKMNNCKSADAKTLAEFIFKTANELNDADKLTYNITLAELTGITDSINEYSTVMTAPRGANNRRKDATTTIKKEVKTVMKLIETKCDRFIGNYAGTDLYNQYFIARIIVDPSYKITTVEGVVKAAGSNNGIYGVKVKATGKETGVVYEEMTDVTGKFDRPDMSPEVYDLEFTVDKYMPMTLQNINLHAGEHQKLNVVLQPTV